MSKITFKPRPHAVREWVYNYNRRVGSIIETEGGFCYQPYQAASRMRGRTFGTVDEVKASLVDQT